MRGTVWLLVGRGSTLLGLVALGLTVYFATTFAHPTDALTFVVLVLTGLLVLTEPRKRLEQRDLFWRYLADAVYEALHNLQHIAKAYSDDGALKGWPQFHVLAARRLIDPPFNDYMLRTEPSLWAHLDHMVRNDEYLRRYPFTHVAVNEAKDIVGYFVEHCLRFVISAGRARESKAGAHVAAVIDTLGIETLGELAFCDPVAVHVRMHEAIAAEDIAGEVHGDGAVRKYRLHGDERAVYWFGTVADRWALWYAFKDLDDPPPRKEFSDSVIRV